MDLKELEWNLKLISLQTKVIDEEIKVVSLQTEIINEGIKTIRLLQKRESAYFFSMGLLFTTIISFFVSQSKTNKIISIFMLVIALIIFVVVKIRKRNVRIDMLNNTISIYKKQGFDEEKIKRLIREDIFFTKSFF